jgi:hypothetical protein
MKTQEKIREIKTYEQICYAGMAATAHFLKCCQSDRALLLSLSFGEKDVRDCHDDLEATYLIRIFAVFEMTLREYWRTGCGKQSHPTVEILLNRIASRRHVEMNLLDNAHAVRDARNNLVHGGQTPPLPLSQARAHLCRFLAKLPFEW